MSRAGGRDWPRELVESLERPLAPSAVLVPILERRDGLTVLLTRRAADLPQHPGQISFPGGRMDPDDPDLAATALRETREEVGIPPEAVEVAGYLPPLPTVTGYAVTPVVGLVAANVELVLDAREVAEAFEVPLAFLLDPGNLTRSVRRYREVDIPVVAFDYGPRRIWGATAAMIVMLKDKLDEK